MNTAPYRLEKYRGRNTRHSCPMCHGRKSFARYIWSDNNEYISEDVGRCNRQDNCGYHLTPKEYWEQQGGNVPDRAKNYIPVVEQYKPRVNLPDQFLHDSLNATTGNRLVKWLSTLINENDLSAACIKYNVGAINAYEGDATAFWFVNIVGEIRACQIKQFDDNGHTASYYSALENRNRKKTTWFHSQLLNFYETRNQDLPRWLIDYIDQTDIKCDCLFGEHLLSLPENKSKPIALVEAPKTALVASMYFPNYLWLATGALDYFTPERVAVLYGREVFLFPDLGATGKWRVKAAEMEGIAYFHIVDILEQIATEQERRSGLDLCDDLTRCPIKTITNNMEYTETEAATSAQPIQVQYSALAAKFKAEFLQKAELPLHAQKSTWRKYQAMGLTKAEANEVANDLLCNHGFVIDNTPTVNSKDLNTPIAA